MRASQGTNCLRNLYFFISLPGRCDIALSGSFLLLALASWPGLFCKWELALNWFTFVKWKWTTSMNNIKTVSVNDRLNGKGDISNYRYYMALKYSHRMFTPVKHSLRKIVVLLTMGRALDHQRPFSTEYKKASPRKNIIFNATVQHL